MFFIITSNPKYLTSPGPRVPVLNAFKTCTYLKYLGRKINAYRESKPPKQLLS